MIIKGKLQPIDFEILKLADTNGVPVTDMKIGPVSSGYLPDYEGLMNKCRFINESCGKQKFYLFGGMHLTYAFIIASSFCEAYETYLEECVPVDEIEDEDNIDHGTFDGSGGWYSEATTSYIIGLPIANYEFLITLGGVDE